MRPLRRAPEPLTFKYFLSAQWKYTEKIYLHSFFNNARNITLARFTLWLLYSRERTYWVRFSMSLDYVANSVLYFSSISTFWRVFHCAKSDRGFWVSIPAINSGKQFIAMWLPFQRHQFYCRLVNSRLGRWKGILAHIAGTKSHFSPIKHSSGTSLRLKCCYLFYFSKRSNMYKVVQIWPGLICM